MSQAVVPLDLTRQAHDLLAYSDPSTAGLWPRAAALLGRQSLEAGLRSFWAETAPGTEQCSMRAQLACLNGYAGEEVAEKASFLYSVLSDACHQHPYDLAPSAAELQGWLSAVEEVLAVLLADR